MGGKEDHDGTDHEILSFKEKDYTSAYDTIDIAKFHALFHQLGSDPKANISAIVEKASELLEACCSLYNRLDEQGKSLFTWAACNLPLEFKRENKPEGHICYEETIKGEFRPVAIEDIGKTSYAETDPNFAKCGLRSYLGFPVAPADRTLGSTARPTPSTEDPAGQRLVEYDEFSDIPDHDERENDDDFCDAEDNQ